MYQNTVCICFNLHRNHFETVQAFTNISLLFGRACQSWISLKTMSAFSLLIRRHNTYLSGKSAINRIGPKYIRLLHKERAAASSGHIRVYPSHQDQLNHRFISFLFITITIIISIQIVRFILLICFTSAKNTL